MPTVRSLVVELSVMVTVGVMLAVLGPFGSFALGGFAIRLAYWVPLALVGYAIYRPITALGHRIAATLRFPEWAGLVAANLAAALPASVAIVLFNGHDPSRFGGADRWLTHYAYVATIGAGVTLLFHLVGRAAAPAKTIGEPAPPPRPRFFDRLPPAWGDRLVALEMEDHYVRAHGPDGRSEMILMRLRDAIEELDGVSGAQVHRSWWVARDAVQGARREARSWRLSLAGGLEAPVARDRVAELRADGWF